MQIEKLGVIIARRVLQKGGGDHVTVLVGKPEQFSDSTDYFCPYQIFGLLDDSIRHASGVDAIQALLLTLERIGVDLYTSEEYRSGNLRFYEEDRDLGFPLPDNLMDLRA